MNKSQKSSFRKNTLVRILTLAILLSGCSDNNPIASTPTIPSTDDAPVINNILTPDQFIWVPHYRLPPDWQINLDNPENARSMNDQGLPAELKVFYLGSADQSPQPAALRDQAYQQVFCQEKDAQSSINCTRGFIKISEPIAGFQAELLRYYGTWRDDNREVNEIFLNHDGQILHITAEGDFQKTLPALESLLTTIQWKLEKPSTEPALQSEEMGL
jgi:hypothetical protein